ncbi:MAG: helix-turn-helix transcriptional regulator [Pseudomonadota bacterium]
MQNSFGNTLKDWRNQRRMSQLDLGLAANVSARHISFLETGRSQPSRPMVLQLCKTLEVPHNARNTLLNAAGFASPYQERDLDQPEMMDVRRALEWTLDRHDPFPAFALDRHWNVIKANNAASQMLAATGLSENPSLLKLLLDPDLIKQLLENWQEVTHHMINRLKTENAYLGGDAVLEDAIQNLSEILGDWLPEHVGSLPPFTPAKYKMAGQTLSLFSTIAQFGTAEDITLAELKIEMMFPADEITHAMLLAMSGQNSNVRSH